MSITILRSHNNILEGEFYLEVLSEQLEKKFSKKNVKLILVESHKKTTITKAIYVVGNSCLFSLLIRKLSTL